MSKTPKNTRLEERGDGLAFVLLLGFFFSGGLSVDAVMG